MRQLHHSELTVHHSEHTANGNINKAAEKRIHIKMYNIYSYMLQLSQAAACDGTTVTTSAVGQEYVPGTLPIY